MSGHVVSADQIFEVVTSRGVGDSPQAAVRNATENALKSTVGTYVDVETILERSVETSDGKKVSNKSIIEKYREYSRGVVMNVDVVEIKIVDSIYRAIVRVKVKIHT